MLLSCCKLMITSQKKSWMLASANILETIFAYSTPKYSAELQLIDMDYINSQEKKIAHGAVYKMPELQDSCWTWKFPNPCTEVLESATCSLLSVINLTFVPFFFFLMTNQSDSIWKNFLYHPTIWKRYMWDQILYPESCWVWYSENV